MKRVLAALLLVSSGASAAAAKLPASVTTLLASELAAPETSYDVKMWLGAVLEGKYQDAAHNWGAVNAALRPQLRAAAEATYLYSLWNQGLAQTFVDQLIQSMGRKSFVESAEWGDLEEQFEPRLATFLQDNAIIFSQEQVSTLDKLPWDGVNIDLKAWSLLRGGEKARAALTHLPVEHPWRHLLELSSSLALAKKKDLPGAIQYLETQIQSGKVQKALLPGYYLQLGRLYYQKAELPKAEENYLKVDLESDEVGDAREELLWVWLRTGDTSRLKGTLEALAQPRFRDRFSPEQYVVSAIANLKLCYYEEVKADFQSFMKQNVEWAKKIDTALNEPSPTLPPNADWYSKLIDSALEKRAVEKEKIKTLFQESIASSLPGIGVQKHWKDAQGALAGHQARLEKIKEAEYRRQWRNNALLLTEAIRKMRFVKIELISQLNAGQVAKPDSEVSKTNEEEAEGKIAEASAGKWSFPFDGVMWPDELFAARSTAHNVCL